MKLQVAFDDLPSGRCLEILEACREDIDVIESGTLQIVREGLAPLREMRKRFPDALLLADPKIMDAPAKLAKACFEAGADVVTVMSAAGKKTLEKVIGTAAECGGKVFVDLLGSADVLRDAAEADALGADYVCVHVSTEGEGPSAGLAEVRKVLRHAELAAAGGIRADNLSRFREADLVIVGSGVYAAEDPVEAVRELRRKIDELS